MTFLLLKKLADHVNLTVKIACHLPRRLNLTVKFENPATLCYRVAMA